MTDMTAFLRPFIKIVVVALLALTFWEVLGPLIIDMIPKPIRKRLQKFLPATKKVGRIKVSEATKKEEDEVYRQAIKDERKKIIKENARNKAREQLLPTQSQPQRKELTVHKVGREINSVVDDLKEGLGGII